MNYGKNNIKFKLLINLILLVSLSSCSINKCRYSNGFNIDFGGVNETYNTIQKKTNYIKIKSLKKTKSDVPKSNIILSGFVGNYTSIYTPKVKRDSTFNTNLAIIKKSLKSKMGRKMKSNPSIDNKQLRTKERNTSVIGVILLEILKFLLYLVTVFLILTGMLYLFIALIGIISSSNLGLYLLVLFLFLILTIVLIIWVSKLFNYHSKFSRNKLRGLNVFRFLRLKQVDFIGCLFY